MKRPPLPSLKLLFFALIVIILIAVASFFGWQWYTLRQQLQQPAGADASKVEIEKVVKEVNALIELPNDEVPTMATVSDIGKLSSQPFFAKAENGDRVLFYTQAKKAYLYRPSSKKLIEVAPLLVGDQPAATATPAPATSSAATKKIKVALLNGSTTTGLTTTAARKLATLLPESQVVIKANAAKTDYTDSIIVNLTNVSKQTIDQLATAFSATADQLPAGESKPDADVVIILAK